MGPMNHHHHMFLVDIQHKQHIGKYIDPMDTKEHNDDQTDHNQPYSLEEAHLTEHRLP